MLRLVAILLVLANGAYFVWTQGWLAPLGFAAPSPSEPQRVAAQIQPDRVSVRREGAPPAALTPRSAASAPPPAATPASAPTPTATAAAPTACLQAAPIDEATLDALKPVLATLPAASWHLESGMEPARWTVYMGKYDAATLDRKKGELARKNIPFDNISVPALQPGLSLGRYSTEGNARTALGQLEKRGVTTAKVVLERPEGRSQVLRFPAADAALQGRLEPLRGVLGEKLPLRPC